MLIVCPNCATSYRIDPESLGESGRSVRCVGCQHLWFEMPREPALLAVDEPALADPTLIRPPLNDVVEVGLGALRPADGHDEAGMGPIEGTGDVQTIDPEPAMVRPGPSLVPADDEAAQNIESFAARRPARRPKARRQWNTKPGLAAVIGALILVLVSLIAARQQVVRHLPQTASLYARIGLPVNLRGLAFENIKTLHETQDGVPMLIVEGDIVGTTARLTEVPRLRFGVLDRDGKEIYAWTARPDRTLLPPGETLPFRSRLASPPAEASSVTVRFFNRRDAQAGFM